MCLTIRIHHQARRKTTAQLNLTQINTGKLDTLLHHLRRRQGQFFVIIMIIIAILSFGFRIFGMFSLCCICFGIVAILAP